MLKSLDIKNFTVFPEAHLQFSPQLNVFVGENGAGKSHLLKLAYAVLSVMNEENSRTYPQNPTKSLVQTRLAEKLVAVLRPEALGRLVRRRQGRDRCELKFEFDDERVNTEFSFAPQSKTDVNVERLPNAWIGRRPVYLPTRELLSIYPGFVSMYDNHYLEFEETWRDTSVLLGAPLVRGKRESAVRILLQPIEEAMGGTVILDNGRFYLRVKDQGEFEVSLVAEGFRKLAMLAQLIATGSLHDHTCLFWDEPEANLNPKLVKTIASVILHLCQNGIQIFIATHSLFLMRELDILLQSEKFKNTKARFFGLHLGNDGVNVEQGDTINDIGEISSLEEELSQSDRYLEV